MAGMDSLIIENLSRSIQVDGAPGGGMSEQRVINEMQRNGVQAGGGGEGDSKTFGELLEKSLSDVNQHQLQADRAIRELVAGRTKNIHETMLAIERADMSLKLAMQVRNKLLDAYREVMRMQV